jgi:tocopherol O-methyltransferase
VFREVKRFICRATFSRWEKEIYNREMSQGYAVTTDAIRTHYDRLSVLYRTFWGDHIHHGLWEGARTAKDAQVALIQRLAGKAKIRRGSHVLDVGCGLGGSSIWLARNLDCSVEGLTISPVQLQIARRRAVRHRVSSHVQFRVEDANFLNYENRFDCVWVIECSEHLFDKALFLRRAADALRPRGVLALCAWLRSDETMTSDSRDVVDRVCKGMLCPSLGTMREYCEWMTHAGLRVQTADDITPAVSKTWDVCQRITQRPVIRQILKNVESDTLAFVSSFDDIAQAYASGAMAYGMCTAVKDSVTRD